MLGDKIYSLRKERKISQDELSEILSTSRQAISKWERNEAKPDIDKLITIAKFFNVSIDYLLNYEINYTDIDAFLNNLKDSYKNNKFNIDINDIKLWCSKYPNNFKLHIYSAEYLYVAFIENNNAEYLDLALSLINKAITLFVPEYNKIVSLNDLHNSVSEIYLMQGKHDLAMKYIENNNVYGCEVLLAKCELALKKYDDALKRSSEIYLKSASDIMNVSYIQIIVLLKSKKIKEAFDLVNWSIEFIKSIHKDIDFFKSVLCPFIYLKATCEQLLNNSSKESIETLKDIYKNSRNQNVVSESNSLKYYFGKTDQMILINTDFKNVFEEIIKTTNKKDYYYQTLVNIYKEILGESINE